MAGTGDPQAVLERLHRAMNEHDLDGFLANIRDDYRSEQPAHPERAFGGREQVRENWTMMFREIPDFRAELVSSVVEGDTIWAEWAWRGRRRDGAGFELRGVTLFGLADGGIVWGRLYMEPVLAEEGDIRTTVRRMTGAG
jgi:ketosteroid isomerase-like protein